jgi:hypothetical protein
LAGRPAFGVGDLGVVCTLEENISTAAVFAVSKTHKTRRLCVDIHDLVVALRGVCIRRRAW